MKFKLIRACKGFLIPLMVFACTKTEPFNSKVEIPSTVDSIWDECEDLPSSIRRERVRVIVSRLREGGRLDELDSFLNKEKERLDNNVHSSASEKLDYDLYLFNHIQLEFGLDSSKPLLIQLLNKEDEMDYPQSQLWNSARGIRAYMAGQESSSKKFFEIVYKAAIKANDSVYEYMSVLNLGALYFKESRYADALGYFKKAYALDKKMGLGHPVLVNNIAACYIFQGDYEEAIEILQQQIEKLGINNRSYAATLLKLSYAQVLQNTQEWSIAHRILAAVSEKDLTDDLKFQWVALSIMDLYQSEGDLKAFLTQHQEFIQQKEIKVALFSRMCNARINWGVENKNLLDFYRVFIAEEDLEPKLKLSQERLPLYNWYQLQLILVNEGILNKGFKQTEVMQKANFALLEYMEARRKTSKASLKTELLMIEKEAEERAILRKQRISELEAEQSKILSWFLGSSTFLLVILIVLAFNNHKRSTHSIKEKLKDQQRESRLLSEKAELSEKNTMLTKAVMDKSRAVANALRSIKIEDTQLQKVIRDLEQVGLLKGSFKEVHDSTIIDEDEWNRAIEKYPVLKDLKETEQKIFLMGNKGVKPKEISIALDISYQYTRNVRSKIRGLLNVGSGHKLERLV